MGFMASAFAGGLAKGYLQGKEQRRQAAIAERELKIKEEKWLKNAVKNLKNVIWK